MVLKVPSAYLNEYSIVFEEEFGVKLSESRLSQIFTKRGINHKKVFHHVNPCAEISFKRKQRSAIKNYGTGGI